MLGHAKSMVGRVVSDKMEKTVIVAVESLKHHRVYGKTLRSVKKYKVHDAESASHAGDLVRIVETRPLSREKRWMLVEILEKAQ
jgi:small subunit ribosomal protein S17